MEFADGFNRLNKCKNVSLVSAKSRILEKILSLYEQDIRTAIEKLTELKLSGLATSALVEQNESPYYAALSFEERLSFLAVRLKV